jgi:hypothetical protein
MHAFSRRDLHNSGDAIARGLRLGGNNGYLLTRQSVEQGTLPGIGPAQYGYES